MRHSQVQLPRGEPAPDLACALRGVHIPMWLMTVAFTAQLFLVPDTWSGLPVTFGVHTSMLVAMASVWPGRSLPRSRLFVNTVLAQLAAVVIGGLVVGRGPLTTLPIAVGSLAYALAIAAAYRRRHDTWCPAGPGDALVFVGYGLLFTPVALVMGELVGTSATTLFTDPTLAFIACLRTGTATSVAIATAIILYFAPPPSSQLIATPLFPFLWAFSLAAPMAITFVGHLPLAWLVLLGPLWSSMVMTPRWMASLILASTGAAALAPYPDFTPGELSWFPPKLFIDALVGFTALAATVVVIARDRNDRLSIEAADGVRAAQEQGELMSTVFQSMSDGLLLADASGRITLSNHAADTMLGAQADDPGSVLNASTTEGPREVLLQDGDIERRVTLLRRPIHLEGSDLTLHLLTDVTQEHLRQRELESFAGTLAHDLKGPLSAVSGWLSAAADEVEDGDAKAGLAAARRASSALIRMRAMIEEYLAYTVRHDGGLLVVDVPLHQVVGDIAAVYEGADRGTVVFEVDVPHVVHADAALTRQLIANLVNNSVKYSRPGEGAFIRVTSTLATAAPGGNQGWVRVQVADRGVGIQPGEEETIFGAYQRSDKDAADYQGIGLGLSLCAQIVARHGGSIRAETNEWGGATITFTLPGRPSASGGAGRHVGGVRSAEETVTP